MSHFYYLWLQITSWFSHFFFANHTQMEENIAEEVSERVGVIVDKKLQEVVDPLVEEQMKTQRLTQAIVDSMRKEGLHVDVSDGGGPFNYGSKSSRNRFNN